MERDDTAQPSQRRNSIDATDDASSDMANMELNSNSSSNPPINIGDCPLTPTRQNTTNTVDDTSRTQSNHVSSINFIRRPVINPYLRQRPPMSNSPNVFAHLISELRTIDSPSAERCQDTTPSQLPTTVVMLNQDVAPSSQSTVLPVVTQTQEVPPPLPHNNSNPSAQQTLQASPPPLPPPLYSSIDYETMEESFPTTIPQRRRDIIINTMKKVWKIDCPREFQIQAIYLMVYCREQVLYLIRKTGEGKSIVFLTIATLLRGITIVLVPLIGLGSDQVTKSINLSHRVESYHVDENKEASFTLLRKRLLSIPPRVRQTSSIILFCSPQSLLKNTAYNKLLRSLASKQLITTIVCDEAHTIPHDGVTFRPEFQEAIKELVSISPNVNFMACSATFGQSDQDKLTNITGKLPTSVYWGEMSRRNIQIVVEIHGQTKLQIKNKLIQDYAKDPFQKVLLYTNSKMNAQDSLTPMAQSVLKSLNIKGEVISFTGDDGIKMKSFVMHSFCREYTEEELVMHDEASLGLVDYASVHDTTKEDTPNVLIVPGTSSMNAGISSKYCKRAYRNGAPPRKLDFVQEMGRVDRDHKAEPGLPILEKLMSLSTSPY
jgi:hypothetical protein